MKKLVPATLLSLICFFLNAQEKYRLMLPPGAKAEALFSESDIEDSYSFENVFDHPVLAIRNGYYYLEDSLGVFMPLPIKDKPIQIQWTIGPTYYSDGGKLSRFFDDGVSEDIIVTKGNNLRFCLEEENNILYFSQGKTLFSLNWDDMTATSLCTFDSEINELTLSGNDCCVIAGASLYLCNNRYNYKLFTAPEEIKTFALGPQGLLFYGTDTGLYCTCPNGAVYPLSNRGVSDVKIIGDSIYILYLDNSAIRIAPLFSFLEIFPTEDALSGIDLNTFRSLRVLSKPGALKLSELRMAVFPEKGLGVIIDNMIVIIENGLDLAESAFLNVDFKTDDYIINKNGPLIMTSGNNIWAVRNKETRQIATVNSGALQMFPGEKDNFYLIDRADSSTVYLCNVTSGIVKPFVRTEENIIAIDGNAENKTVFSKGNDIIQYLDGNFEILYSASRQITALCLVLEGLVFSTPYGVYFLSQNKKLKQLFDIGATQLLYGNATLYIVFRSGEICSINPNEFRQSPVL